MKKLSFIMAVLMILMCMPIMAISAAETEEVVAPDANAPETVTMIELGKTNSNYELYSYPDDVTAADDGAIGRFTKEGGNGYAKSWSAVVGNTKDCGATVFYLIKDVEVDKLGGNTGFHIGARTLVIDGGLGQDKSEYGFTMTVADIGGSSRFLHIGKKSDEPISGTNAYQSTVGRVGGNLTFRNVYVDASAVTGAVIQQDANVAGPALTFDNVYFDATKATFGVVARGYNQILTFNKVYMHTLGNGSNSAVVYADKDSGDGDFTLNITDSDLKGTNYCVLFDRKNANITANVKNSVCINDRPARSAASLQMNSGFFNVNVDGGVYGEGLGFLVNSGAKTGSVFNIYNGTFRASGSTVSNAFRCQCANDVTVNIYGGTWSSSENLIDISAAGNGTFNFYGGNFQGNKQIIYFGGSGNNNTINIYGGNFSGSGRMIRLAGTEVNKNPAASEADRAIKGSATLNIFGGTFVAKKFKKGMDSFSSTPTPETGLILVENNNAINISGGRFTVYEDNGITLNSDDAFVYVWENDFKIQKYNSNEYIDVTPVVNVTGGSFNGGKCFVADVVYTGNKNAPVDEAKSKFYYYTEGTDGVSLEPKAVQGASVRLDKDSSGLRFTATIDALAITFIKENLAKEGTELTYGTMIVPSNYVKYAGGVLTMEAFDKAGKAYLNIEAKDGVVVNEDGSVTINAAMVNIKKENYDRDFIAVAYIKYTDNTGSEVIKYATNVNLAAFSRNVQEVAHAALADVRTTEVGTYTNKVNGYYVWNQNARKYAFTPGTAYSRYNAEQIAVLESYILSDAE